MIRVTAVIFSLIAASLLNAQNVSQNAKQFTLQGKLLKQILMTPDCGIFAFATVAEFEIVKFSDSSYKGKNIPVVITCPEMYEKEIFKPAQTYRITIVDKNPDSFGWLIPNDSLFKKYPIAYKPFALKVVKVQ